MLPSETNQVEMAQDRSSLNSFLAVLSVKQVMDTCTEVLAKKGSQCGDEGVWDAVKVSCILPYSSNCL